MGKEANYLFWREWQRQGKRLVMTDGKMSVRICAEVRVHLGLGIM